MSLTELISRPITSGIKSKIRLWIEYALVAVVVALAALVVVGWLKQAALKLEVSELDKRADKAEDRVALVEAVNKSQAEALENIQKIREVDSEVLNDLSEDMNKLHVRDRTVAQRIAYLEKTNAAVRAYLDASLPAVGCVLDNSCEASGFNAGGGPRPARPADGAVPAAVPGARRDGARPGREQ